MFKSPLPPPAYRLHLRKESHHETTTLSQIIPPSLTQRILAALAASAFTRWYAVRLCRSRRHEHGHDGYRVNGRCCRQHRQHSVRHGRQLYSTDEALRRQGHNRNGCTQRGEGAAEQTLLHHGPYRQGTLRRICVCAPDKDLHVPAGKRESPDRKGGRRQILRRLCLWRAAGKRHARSADYSRGEREHRHNHGGLRHIRV